MPKVNTLHLLKHPTLYGVLLLLLALYLAPAPQLINADADPAPEGLTNVRFDQSGAYSLVAAGDGMESDATGTITLNVPGTPVAAYLYWAGFETGTGDNTVDLSVDGSPVVPITATSTYSEPWFQTNTRFTYVADVTAQVLQGNHTYTVTNFSIANEDGAGLIVVYNDPGQNNRIIIRDGLDIFFPSNASPQNQHHSEASSFTFTAAAADRTMSYIMFATGIGANPNQPGPGERTHTLWEETGTGAPPARLFDVSPLGPPLSNLSPDATKITGPDTGVPDPANPSPFFDSDGDEWDTYRNTLNIPANDEYAVFQIQTFLYQAGGPSQGASGAWFMLAASIPLAVQPPTATPTPTPTNTPAGVPTSTPTPIPTAVGGAGGGTGGGSGVSQPASGGQQTCPFLPDLTLVGDPPTVIPGGTVEWTLTARNTGGDTLNGVVISAALDGSLFASISDPAASRSIPGSTVSGLNVTFDVGQMAPFETLVLTFKGATLPGAANPGTANSATISVSGCPPQSRTASIGVITTLPNTGYPPGEQGAILLGLLALGLGVGLVTLGVIGIRRRRSA